MYDADGNWTESTSRDHHDVPPYVTPAVLATISGDYTPARGATIGAAWRYVGESHLDNTGNQDFTAPPFTCLDVSGSVDLARLLTFAARAHPVLRAAGDQRARQPADVPERLQLPVLHGRTGPAALVLEGTRYYYPLATRSAFVGLELRF